MFLTSFAREIKDWLEYFVARIPGRLGNNLRNFYFKKRFSGKFSNNRFEPGFRVEFPKNIKIRSNSFYGLDCKLYASKTSSIQIGSNISFNSNVMINARGVGKIIIGNNVLIGPNVVIRSNNHQHIDASIPIKEQGMTKGEIIIKDNVWISSNCVILPNCTIGEGAIVAAGAVVTKDVEPFSIVGGIPAKIIGKRNG